MPTNDPKPKGKFVGLAALVGAAAAAIIVPTVQLWEGREHVPYRDIVGIWTVCDGDTKNVVPGRAETDEECDARLERQLIAHARPVLRCVPQLGYKPNALAASVSLAYNIGPTAFCRSRAAGYLRAGNIAKGCGAFINWRFAGGKEIRGLKRRRLAEMEICLRDAR